jgi:hypothetical protein
MGWPLWSCVINQAGAFLAAPGLVRSSEIMQQPAWMATRATPLSSVASLGGVVELGAAVGGFPDEGA